MKIDLPGVWDPLDLTVDEVPVTETDLIFRALILDLIEHERWIGLAELREALRNDRGEVAWATPYFEFAELLRDEKKDELTREKLEAFFQERHVLEQWVRYQVNSLIGPDVFPEVILASRKTPIARNLKGRFRDRSQSLLVLQLVKQYFPDFLENLAQFFPKERKWRDEQATFSPAASPKSKLHPQSGAN